MTVILGAGLAGLSASFHLKHKAEIFEKSEHTGGHIFSYEENGFTWDEGPHVSFTKHQYVRDLFAESCEILEYPVYPTNYYRGNWIDHPAQTNLYAVPEPLRTECLESFLQSRTTAKDASPKNYKEWLNIAFGKRFSEVFPEVYTNKYWTTPAENLTTDWVGQRVYFPKIEDVSSGYKQKPEKIQHYVTQVRYPKKGGYFSFANKLKKDARVNFKKEVKKIDLDSSLIFFTDGTSVKYTKLINTIPMPEFIGKSTAPPYIKSCAERLSCSTAFLINVVANHPPKVHNQWLYVYDADKYSTRISYTDLFSPQNGEPGKCGIQVEVYYSKYRPKTESDQIIIKKVCDELIEMGLVENSDSIVATSSRLIEYANVIFDHERRSSLDSIYEYLSQYGLQRESDDLEAMTDWDKKLSISDRLGNLDDLESGNITGRTIAS